MSTLACQGCGQAIAAESPTAFRCPNAGRDAGDHVVGRTLDPANLRFPLEGSANPFERYRHLTHAHALATSHGLSDVEFEALVRALDHAVAHVAGHGFIVTPFSRSDSLSDALSLQMPGGVWMKDETSNVSGSHKGRHLMGLAILGEVRSRIGIAAPTGRLAIASCGNAALAAAVVARAWNRPLDVFIPTDANPRVVYQLEQLAATIHVCPRQDGVAGDPCYHAFRAAIADGAFPFCCQGSDNGLTIEGGETLAWEMIGDLVRSRTNLDRLFVQVGGGALASACVQGFRDAISLGAPVTMPRIHAVQTSGGYPLRRAWERLTERIAAKLGFDARVDDTVTADRIRARVGESVVASEIEYAARHRAEFMWPWETEPKSIAHGILDDETYDWLAIVRGMIESGGFPLVVSEAQLVEANTLGRERTGIDVDPTGSSGLAGVLEMRARGVLRATEAIAVLFTGVKR